MSSGNDLPVANTEQIIMLRTKAAQNVPRPNFLDCPAEFVDVCRHKSVRVSYRSVAPSLCCLPTHWKWQRPEEYCLRDYRHTKPPALSQCIDGVPSYLLELSDAFKRHVLSANKGHSLAQNKWRELSKTASYWVSQLYLPFAFSVPLKDQSWCEVPQERKREDNKLVCARILRPILSNLHELHVYPWENNPKYFSLAAGRKSPGPAAKFQNASIRVPTNLAKRKHTDYKPMYGQLPE